MSGQIEPGPRILLLGIESTMTDHLEDILSRGRFKVYVRPFLPASQCLEPIAALGPDVVCCSSEQRRYARLVESMKSWGMKVPVVVVSAAPELAEWLDVIEAGAWDYIGPPLESAHLQFVLENAMRCAGATAERPVPGPQRARLLGSA